MKRLTLLLLLMISTNVLAEWTEISRNNDVGLVLYIDYKSIKKTGNKVKMWKLDNFKTVQKFDNLSYLSSVTHEEYDCEEETKRMLDFSWYSGNMGVDNVVVSESNLKEKSESIRPNSMSDILLKIVCGKK